MAIRGTMVTTTTSRPRGRRDAPSGQCSGGAGAPFHRSANERGGQPRSDRQRLQRGACDEGAHHPAAHYIQQLNLQLKPEKIRQLAIDRAKNEFIPKIKKLYPRFDDFPVEAREAIFDIAYNGGVGRPESGSGGTVKKATGLYKFTHLKAAIDAGDWTMAARVSHRKSSRPERNQFVFDLFERAAQCASMRTGAGRNLHLFDQRLTRVFR